MATGELDELKGAALAADAPPAPPAPPPPPAGSSPGAEAPAAAPQLSPAEDWAQVPAIFGRILGRWFPELDAIYTDQANLKWGESMLPLAEKYGWTSAKFFAWLGPWVGLAMATEALATPTFIALAARVKAAKEARAKAEAEAGAAVK